MSAVRLFNANFAHDSKAVGLCQFQTVSQHTLYIRCMLRRAERWRSMLCVGCICFILCIVNRKNKWERKSIALRPSCCYREAQTLERGGGVMTLTGQVPRVLTTSPNGKRTRKDRCGNSLRFSFAGARCRHCRSVCPRGENGKIKEKTKKTIVK